jgi:hypothetical protein
MKLAELDESLTPVPIDAAEKALEGVHETAVLPAQDQVAETACLLVAGRRELLVACRADGERPSDPPTVSVETVDWHAVGIGPFGLAGRVAGGLLGGAEATDHLLTVVAGDRLFEARLPGSRGPEATESFAKAARLAGARDFFPDP